MKMVKQYWQLWLLTASCLFLIVLPTSPAMAALAKGTNCGFVAVAPTVDPAGADTIIDTWSKAFKDVAPAGATAITSIIWWCDTASEEANFEVGLYSHNVVDDEPEELLQVERTNAKGTDAGFKVVAVNWPVTGGVTYWPAVQLDDTTTITNSNLTASTGDRYSKIQGTGITTLPNPWGNGTESENLFTICVVYQLGGGQAVVGRQWFKVLGGGVVK